MSTQRNGADIGQHPLAQPVPVTRHTTSLFGAYSGDPCACEAGMPAWPSLGWQRQGCTESRPGLLLRYQPKAQCHLLMDRAHEGDEIRQLALDLGFIPVVPPKQNRITTWEYDRAMYRRRNEIERLFRHLKSFRPEKLSSYLLQIRETRRYVTGFYPLCSDHRKLALV